MAGGNILEKLNGCKVCMSGREARRGGQEAPIVRFRNGAETEILPSLFSTSVQNTGDCRRVQVPLKLAWVRGEPGQVRGRLSPCD